MKKLGLRGISPDGVVYAAAANEPDDEVLDV